jgi:hypothetical protein
LYKMHFWGAADGAPNHAVTVQNGKGRL